MPLQKAQELRQPSRRNYLCLDQAPAARPCLLFEAAGTAGQACAARLATAHAAAPPAPTHQRHCFAQLAQGRPKHTSGTKSSERRDLELGLSVGGLQLVQPSSPARSLLLSAQLLQIRHVLQRPHHRASVPGQSVSCPSLLFPAYYTRSPSCSPCADQARLAQCPHRPTHAGQDMPRASTRWAQRLAVHHTDWLARVQSVEQEHCCCVSVSVCAIVNAYSTDLWRPTPARAAALPATFRHALRVLSPPSPFRAPPPGSVGC